MKAGRKRCKKRGCPHYIHGNKHHVSCRTPDVDLSVLGKQTHSKRLYDDKRGSSAKRGYGYRWQKVRIGFLKSHPLCCFCEQLGIVTAAEVVDHIKPYSSVDRITGKKVYDKVLQWEHDNWQSVCAHHHNVDKQHIEDRWRKGLLPDEALKGIDVKLSMPA